MNGGFVDADIDEALFTTGVLSLTPSETKTLGLPAHPSSVTIILGDEEIVVPWQSRARHLGGETLLECLEIHTQVGGLLRLHPPRDGEQVIAGRFIDRTSSVVGHRGLIQQVARPSAGSGENGNRATPRDG